MAPHRFAAAAVASLALLASTSPGAAESWSQLYAGAGIGVNAFTGEGELFTKNPTTSVLQGSGPFGADLGASFFVGADYQINRWLVVGAFVSYDWSDAAIKIRVREASQSASADATVVSIEDMWTIGGRLGLLATDKTMIYGILGYSWINVDDLKVSFNVPGNSGSYRLPLPGSQGVTFGGGIEHKLSTNVALRAEYRTTSYGRETLYDDENVTATGRAQSHIARISALYRLGGGAAQDEAPPVVLGGWSGPYIGVGVGLGAYTRDLKVRGDSAGHFGDVFEITGLGGGDVVASITGGYDFRVAPRIVAGIVLSADFAGGQEGLKLSAPGGGDLRLDLLNARYSWSIGARVGYLLSPSLLGYLSGGYTQIQFDDATASISGQDVYRFAFPRLSGGFVGVGFEKQMMSGLTVRTEYQAALYERLGQGFATSGGDQARVLFEPVSHSVKLSINYRFGGGAAEAP